MTPPPPLWKILKTTSANKKNKFYLESFIVGRFVVFLLVDLQFFVGRFVVFCWEICSFSFILVWDSFIVGRFVVIVGTVYYWEICLVLLGDIIVT